MLERDKGGSGDLLEGSCLQAEGEEENFEAGQDEEAEEEGELAHIEGTHAVVDPGAMVVVPPDANPAGEAVELVVPDLISTLRAQGQGQILDILGVLPGVFLGEQVEDSHDQEVVGPSQSVEQVRGVQQGHFREDVGGQEQQVEHQQEDQTVRTSRLLDPVHDLHVAGDLQLLAAGEVIVEDPHHLKVPLGQGDVDGPFVLLVADVPPGSLHQHPFDHILVPCPHCQHQGSGSFVVDCVSVQIPTRKSQQVRQDSVVSLNCCQMQGSIALLVCRIRIEGQFSLPVLEQVGEGVESVILDSHEQQILLLAGGGLHIGSVTFQEVHHFNVAMQDCEVRGRHALVTLDVDPGLQLILEGRSISVVLEALPCEGLKVQHIDLEFLELVFEGSEVEKGGSILLAHESDIEFGTILEVAAEVVVAFESHDGVYWSHLGRHCLVAHRILWATKLIEFCYSKSGKSFKYKACKSFKDKARQDI